MEYNIEVSSFQILKLISFASNNIINNKSDSDVRWQMRPYRHTCGRKYRDQTKIRNCELQWHDHTPIEHNTCWNGTNHCCFYLYILKHYYIFSRHCGRLLCSKCSGKDMPIIKYNIPKPVRVCETCFDVLTLGGSIS